MMNIAALMGAASVMPEQGNTTAKVDASTTGEFKNILQTLVTGGATTQTTPSTSTQQAATTAPNWLGLLLKLFDNDPLASQTPDPTGEALPTDSAETAVSLTELMTALQPLVGQSNAALNTTALTAALPETAQTTTDETALETDAAMLAQLAQLIAPTTPNLVALPVATVEGEVTPNTAAAILAQAHPNVDMQLPVDPNQAQANRNGAAPQPATPAIFSLVTDPTAPAVPVEPAKPATETAAASTQTAQNQLPQLNRNFAAVAPKPNAPVPAVTTELPAKPAPETATTATPSTQTQPLFTPAAISAATPDQTPATKGQPEQTKPATTQPAPAATLLNNVTTDSTSAVATAKETASGANGLTNVPAVQQIVESVKLLSQRGNTEMRLQLRPESLGQVLVQVRVADGNVTVRMLAETSQAQSLLQEHLPQLKSAFASQGVQVNTVNIDMGNNASAFDTPGRQPNSGQFFGHNNYLPNGQQRADEPIAAIRPRTNLLSNLYSVDFQA